MALADSVMHGGVDGHRLLYRQAATFRQRRGDVSVLYGLHQVNSLQCRDDFYRGFADADLLGFVGNHYSRELFIVPVWRKSWWQGVWYEIRWYLFLAKRPSADIGHNPIAQAAMFGYFLMSVFMIITGFALYSEHSQYAIFAPFRYVVEFFYWTGGNSMDIHSWHRLGMWLIGAFVIGHVYMALREDIMSDDTVISTMVNGYRSHKFGKISNKERS